MTPALCKALTNRHQASITAHYALVGIYAVGFALAVNTTLDITIEQITWLESLFYQWPHHVIAYITIVFVWHLKYRLFNSNDSLTTLSANKSCPSEPVQDSDQDKTQPPKPSINKLTHSQQTSESQTQSLCLELDNIQIKLDDIVFIKAAGNYIEVTCKSKTHLLRATMKELNELLPSDQFFRSHRSYFINMSYAQKVINERSGHGLIVLKNQQHVPVSKSKRQAAHAMFGQ
nr:LytTR family DNA-binding domain-containing protein [Pseudoalteromonas caenipelagi]